MLEQDGVVLVREVAVLAAGGAGMPFGRFLLYNLIGTVPKCLLFMVIGYTIGAAYASIDSWIARATILIGAVLFLAALFWFVRRRAKRK